MNKSMNTKTLLMKITQGIVVSGTLLSVSFASNPPTIPTAGPAAIPTSAPAVMGGAPASKPAANPAAQPPAPAAANAPTGGLAQHIEAKVEAKHEEHPATPPAGTPPTPTPAPTPPVVSAPTPEPATSAAPLPIPANPPVAPAPAPAPAGPPVIIAPLEEPKKEEVKGPLFEESSGLDNINLVEGGNWYLKRQALEQTVDTIEQINELFNKIVLLNTDYLVKRNKVDTEMENFILKMGIDIGDLDQRLQEIVQELEGERTKEGELSEHKRDIEHDAEQKKADVEKLQTDLKEILKLNDKLDATMEMVSTQIKKANDYQAMAWKNFQTIKKILSDEKARELYYQTDGLFKSILALYEYLQTPLMNYFNEHIELLRSKMGAIQGSFDTLKTKGIDLQKMAHEPEKKPEPAVEEKPKEVKKEKKQGWFESVIHTISLPFVYVYEGFKLIVTEIYQWIFGAKKTKPIAAPAAPVAPVSPEHETPTAATHEIPAVPTHEMPEAAVQTPPAPELHPAEAKVNQEPVQPTISPEPVRPTIVPHEPEASHKEGEVHAEHAAATPQSEHPAEKPVFNTHQ